MPLRKDAAGIALESEPLRFLAARTGRELFRKAAAACPLHMGGQSRSLAASRRDSRIEPDRLATIESAFTKRTRADSKSIRFLTARMGSPRRLPGERFVPRGLGGGGRQGDSQ